MKYLTVFTLLLLFSCNREKSRNISIDTNIDYPKKEINLSEIMDFEYIKLETSEESLIGGTSSLGYASISDNLIVVGNQRGGEIFFFGRDGKFLHSFNHKGNGSGEYKKLNSLVVDFDNEKIYVYDIKQSARVLVYSFVGDYIKTLELENKDELKTGVIYNYDNDYLIAYNTEKLDNDIFFKDAVLTQYPYLLISKFDGAIKTIDLKIDNRFGDKLMGMLGDKRIIPITFPSANIYKNGTNTIISDFALDTVYSYNDQLLEPLFEIKKYDKKVINTLSGYSDRYILMNMFEKPGSEAVSNIVSGSWKMDFKQYLIDREKEEVFEIEKLLSNDGVEYLLNGDKSSLPGGCVQFQLEALKLVELYEAGKLSGELKTVALTLKEDDNPVLVLMKFKE